MGGGLPRRKAGDVELQLLLRPTETMLLGNLALRAGGRIEWDAKDQKVTNLPAANKFVRREYRSGYSI